MRRAMCRTLLRFLHEHADERYDYENEGIQILDDPCVRQPWIGTDDCHISVTKAGAQFLHGSHTSSLMDGCMRRERLLQRVGGQT